MRGDPAAWDWGVGGWGVLVASCDEDVDEEDETLPPPLYIMAGLNRLPNEDSSKPLPTIKFVAAWLEFEDDEEDEDDEDEGAEASLEEETIAADEDDDDEDDEEEEEEEEEVDDGVGADVADAVAGAETNSSLFCWPAATTNEAWFGGITFPK